DGITEARSEVEFFGEARVLALAADNAQNAATLVDAVVSGAVGFQRGFTRDDIAVVSVGVPD
ncbi:MAG: SpoIIE family protein phosphatase, partial [Acidimicrobiales bacterium]|nr:SpoIIE family protein phosphatase [Acidimicrobiales bacterium]